MGQFSVSMCSSASGTYVISKALINPTDDQFNPSVLAWVH